MKKLIVGLLAAFLMSMGLVGFTSASASAACTAYQGCASTKMTIVPTRTGKTTEKITVTVRTKAPSSAKPVGKVKITVLGKGGAVKVVKLSKGAKAAATFKKLAFGRHAYKVQYLPKKGSAFKGSVRKGHFFLAK